MSQVTHSNPAMRSTTDLGIYTKPATTMHWTIALLVFAVPGFGLHTIDISGFTPVRLKLFSYHKWIGITVLILVVLCVP